MSSLKFAHPTVKQHLISKMARLAREEYAEHVRKGCTDEDVGYTTVMAEAARERLLEEENLCGSKKRMKDASLLVHFAEVASAKYADQMTKFMTDSVVDTHYIPPCDSMPGDDCSSLSYPA